MEAEIAAVRWSLGYLRSEQLPPIALTWLEAGLDTPALRELAGESKPTMSEAGPLFERVLTELGVPVPSRSAAAMQLTHHIAREISTGSKPPYNGAKEIWTIELDCEEACIPVVFAGLVSEHDDFGDDYHRQYYGEEGCRRKLKEIEGRIVDEARKLLTYEQ